MLSMYYVDNESCQWFYSALRGGYSGVLSGVLCHLHRTLFCKKEATQDSHKTLKFPAVSFLRASKPREFSQNLPLLVLFTSYLMYGCAIDTRLTLGA